MEEDIEGRVFIVGCARSGTTLLQSLIASHNDVISFPESHAFYHIFKNKWNRLLRIRSFEVKKKINDYLRSINEEKMVAKFPKNSLLAKNYVKGFTDILDSITSSRKKKIWIEKTPRHLHYIDEIERYIEGAKFIHLIRRGEDVVASLIDVTRKYPEEWGGERTVKQCVRRWNRDVKISMEHIGKKNHTLVKFEELLENTERVLTEICNFLGIEFHKEMLAIHHLVAESLVLQNEKWKNSVKSGINRNPKVKFDNLFDQEEKDYILNNLERIDF